MTKKGHQTFWRIDELFCLKIYFPKIFASPNIYNKSTPMVLWSSVVQN